MPERPETLGVVLHTMNEKTNPGRQLPGGLSGVVLGCLSDFGPPKKPFKTRCFRVFLLWFSAQRDGKVEQVAACLRASAEVSNSLCVLWGDGSGLGGRPHTPQAPSEVPFVLRVSRF